MPSARKISVGGGLKSTNLREIPGVKSPTTENSINPRISRPNPLDNERSAENAVQQHLERLDTRALRIAFAAFQQRGIGKRDDPPLAD